MQRGPLQLISFLASPHDLNVEDWITWAQLSMCYAQLSAAPSTFILDSLKLNWEVEMTRKNMSITNILQLISPELKNNPSKQLTKRLFFSKMKNIFTIFLLDVSLSFNYF